MKTSFKEHWEKVYHNKTSDQISWTQTMPEPSLSIIRSLNLDKSASIIDIGGGDSKLVDFLLNDGYTNLTVLDISAKALNRAKQRLGEKAVFVKWIEADINHNSSDEKYDLWHDRAAFHFITDAEQIKHYVSLTEKFVDKYFVMATFSHNGPDKCSGLINSKYDEKNLVEKFNHQFEKMNCFTQNHQTPFNTIQNFLFCCFKKRHFA